MARPSKYTADAADLICEKLTAGETLRAICRNDASLPAESTVRQWVTDNHEGFAERYARARNMGLDGVADEIVDISDDARNDWMRREDPDNPGYDVNGEHIARSRLRVDSRKWYLSKMAPKRYGERTTIAGDPEAPLVFEHRAATPEQLEAQIMGILLRVAARRAYERSISCDLSKPSKALGRLEEVRDATRVIEEAAAEAEIVNAIALPPPDLTDLA